jgi:hypothetical protein
MANFFSADYWKALYFKAMGGQETAVDPNAMSGSFAGSSSWTGTLDPPVGFISGSFAGSSTFTATLSGEGIEEVQSRSQGGFEDPYYYKKRRKKKPEPVSKGFGDDWQPPTPRPAIPPLAAQQIIARQDAAFARTQAAIVAALEQYDRQRAEALARAAQEQEDEDEAILLLMAA